MDDTPQYVQPPPDPALVQLQQQSANDRLNALQDQVTAANTRHSLIYGMTQATAGPLALSLSSMPKMVGG